MIKHMNCQNLKNKEKGITLIALVVTIVVLIILATVSVNALVGENGIITKAQKAKDLYGQSKAAEEDALNQIANASIPGGTKSEDLNKTGTTTVIGEKVSDGLGGILPVPEGFYFVGGSVSKGAVISDNANDKNRYQGQEVVGTDLVGNQFVWIPVSDAGLTYGQDHTFDSKYSGSYTSAPTGETDIGSWEDSDAATTTDSVKNYGGFYIGRYEAGYPEKITAGTTVANKNSATGKVPLSKAGVVSWNLVSQTEAKIAAESMYSSTSKVTSKLVNSYAWDTTCRWLINSNAISVINGAVDSKAYGNYLDATFKIKQGSLYVSHIYLIAKSGTNATTGWYMFKGGTEKYATVTDTNGMSIENKATTVPTDLTNSSDYTANERTEIATGTADATRTNNIYDMAGNMWEWTTETITRKKNSTSNNIAYATRRGGGIDYHGSGFPIIYRYGGSTTNLNAIYVGFRTVLYIK